MKEEQAMKCFHGEDDLNCVQSVLKVYRREFNLSDEFINNAQIYGGGRAQYGVCGALYAIKMLIQESNPETYKIIAKQFKEETGSLFCEEIKELEKKTCKESVGIAARCLEYYINNDDMNCGTVK